MTEAEFLERVRELTPYQLARFAEMLAELVRECQEGEVKVFDRHKETVH